MTGVTIPARLFRAEPGLMARADDGEENDRNVRLSFSSEVEVARYFGIEILGHADGEADLSRLNTGHAPLLLDHDTRISAKVGTISRAEIVNGRGEAVVTFAASAQAEEILARIRDGEAFAVSVGYRVERFAKMGERDGNAILRAIRWQPYEVSLVAVPADTTVGVGRSDVAETDQVNVAIEGESHMPNENPAPAVETRAAQPVAPVDTAALLRDERARAAHIRSVGDKMGLPADMVVAAVDSGESMEAFNSRALEHLGSHAATETRARAAKIGLTDKEEKSYSFVRLLDYLADPTNKSKREAAAFERECAEAAAAKHDGEIRGALIPVDVLASRSFIGNRAPSNMLAGTATAGGNLIAKELLSGSFIDMLREIAILPQLGATMLGGLVGNIDIPKKTSAGSARWVSEDGIAAASAIGIGQVSASPKILSARTQISRKLLKQSSIDAEMLIRKDFAETIGLEIDRCAIYGSAEAGAPDGLDEKAGVARVQFAVAGRPTFAEIVSLWSAVRTANAARGSLGFALNPVGAAHLMTTAKFAGSDSPIMAALGQLLGYKAPESNQIAAQDFWFGNWADLVICSWGGLDILVDPYTASDQGAVRVTAFQETDFVVRNEGSFARGHRAAA